MEKASCPKKRYELATLGETVDSRCLPAGYSAGVIPLPNACDHCCKKLDDGEVLVCEHGYHFEYYQMMEYEKGPNVLTTEERENSEEASDENETVEEKYFYCNSPKYWILLDLTSLNEKSCFEGYVCKFSSQVITKPIVALLRLL
ncbi:11341_t:CDS:2 [Ambispora leptoticha]|uniref:11341_t:CDS:1 n=1 Tax=Ambispora leptoticha TaxID=144679 RepID=A0A9N9ABX4_9GLOM|nr:11341_t:CDS:2 [Ambispora leptoticha]